MTRSHGIAGRDEVPARNDAGWGRSPTFKWGQPKAAMRFRGRVVPILVYTHIVKINFGSV
jgi:hypothetical protein